LGKRLIFLAGKKLSNPQLAAKTKSFPAFSPTPKRLSNPQLAAKTKV